MNGGIYSTGNEIVDENAKLNISGNIIPQVWYRTIIRESGKPNLTAIIILADIVYWYKPTEIRDEGTGQVIGVRKKFKSDLLQRSYQQISEQFGISKKEATNAVVFLEKLGVVKRVFRTISMNGIVVNNVLYLELIVDRLKELTYPEETGADPVSFEKRREKSKAEKISSHTAIEEEIHFVEERTVPFQRKRVSPFKEGAYPDRETEPWIPKEVPQTDSGQTNTEITTKTTAESTQKNTTEIGNGYRDNPILSYQAAEEQFKDQIDYDAIWIDRPFDRKLLNEIVGLAVDVLTSNAKTIRVNQEERPLGIVQGMYKKLDKFTVAICDDDKQICSKLIAIVKEYFADIGRPVWVAEFTSGLKLLKANIRFDVIFLDIDMPGLNGIETAKKLRNCDVNSKIVYVTNYSKYASCAYKVHAFDYVEKPVRENRIFNVLKEVIHYLDNSIEKQKFAFTTEKGVLTLELDDIYYFEYMSRRVLINTSQGEYIATYSLKELYEKFNKYNFESPHKSFIINMLHIKRIKGFDILMENGGTITLAQKRAVGFKAKFNDFLQSTFDKI